MPQGPKYGNDIKLGKTSLLNIPLFHDDNRVHNGVTQNFQLHNGDHKNHNTVHVRTRGDLHEDCHHDDHIHRKCHDMDSGSLLNMIHNRGGMSEGHEYSDHLEGTHEHEQQQAKIFERTQLNPLQPGVAFLYTVKTSENL